MYMTQSLGRIYATGWMADSSMAILSFCWLFAEKDYFNLVSFICS